MTIHVTPVIGRASSGPSYSVPRLCEAVIDAGEEVILATSESETQFTPPPFIRSFPFGAGPRRLGRMPALRRWLMAQVRAGTAGIIHSHGLWRMSCIYAAQAVRGGRVPLVVSPHGMFSPHAMRHGLRQAKRLFWIAFQRRALDRVDCFRATSEIEYEDIRRLGFQQPVALIPNGIDLPHLSQPEQTKDRTLLFLGRLHPIKGVDTLIEAWRTVQDDFPSWRLLIVGNDTNELGTSGYMAELRRFVSDQGTARVSFAGELIGAAKLDAYTNASVYVLPSHSENFGLTVAEALSVGTPVITTDRTPWRGLEARGAGWFIESGPVPLALCLREALATDEAVLRRMGLSGRRWMQTEFSWTDIGRRMVATYRWVRGETAAQPPWVYAD